MEVTFVTGGAGFIGSHLADQLLKKGHKVVSYDNFDPFYDRVIKEDTVGELTTHGMFSFVEGDIRDSGVVHQALRGVDLVVHMKKRGATRFVAEVASVRGIQDSAYRMEHLYGREERVSWSSSQ